MTEKLPKNVAVTLDDDLCIWRHRAKQLEAESQDLQDRIGWYRARYHELKEENRRLHAELARYYELNERMS